MVTPEVRQRVASRALRCCEYCLIHESDAAFAHEVDHIISRKHGGRDDEDNLAYACFACNRFKGSDLGSLGPDGAFVAFFHPRLQPWVEHFWFDGRLIVPRTATGLVTARIFQFNSAERILERQDLARHGRYPWRP